MQAHAANDSGVQFGLFGNDDWSTKAEAFIQDNPDIWQLFCELTIYAAKRSHNGKVGAKAVFERMRWEYDIERGQAEKFKLNNNYTRHFSLRFQQQHPELGAVFNNRG